MVRHCISQCGALPTAQTPDRALSASNVGATRRRHLRLSGDGDLLRAHLPGEPRRSHRARRSKRDRQVDPAPTPLGRAPPRRRPARTEARHHRGLPQAVAGVRRSRDDLGRAPPAVRGSARDASGDRAALAPARQRQGACALRGSRRALHRARRLHHREPGQGPGLRPRLRRERSRRAPSRPCPAESAAASSWRARSCPSRTCCSSTSRPTTSTSPPPSTSRSACGSGRRRSCWSRTIAISCARSAARSSSSRTARPCASPVATTTT